MIMKLTQVGRVVGLALVFGACAPAMQYPEPETLGSDINPNFDFGNVKSALETYRGAVFQVGGEMVRVESRSDGVRIFAKRMLIQQQLKYPWYAPVELAGAPIDEFVVFYPGHVDGQGLMLGNKFIAAAELVGTEKMDAQPLSFRVRCMHIWKTGQNRIAELPDKFIQLYQALEEDTYCARPS